jgi:hypothetical protein
MFRWSCTQVAEIKLSGQTMELAWYNLVFKAEKKRIAILLITGKAIVWEKMT